jgi:hypothetical protein
MVRRLQLLGILIGLCPLVAPAVVQAEPPAIDAAASASASAARETALSISAAFYAAVDDPAPQLAALPYVSAPPIRPKAATATAVLPIVASAPMQDVRGALPPPPAPPLSGPGTPATGPLPHTGLYLRQMPALPRLVPQGRLAALPVGRPYPGFNAQLDCIIDHQRFDSRGARQKYPHVCAPTRDLDFDLPAFTTR